MNRAQIMLGTVPAATMFKRDSIGPASTSPDVSSDLASNMCWLVSKRKTTSTEYENYHN